MLDKRGVMRGTCRDCGEGCTEYWYVERRNQDDDKCSRCSCPPHYHQKCTLTSWRRNDFFGLSGLSVRIKSFNFPKYPLLWFPPGSSPGVKVTAQDLLNKGKTGNVAEAAAKSAGGLGFGIGGAAAGASIGTAILPGIGTVVGGLIGSIAGAKGGSKAAGAVVKKFMGENDFPLEDRKCELCSKTFKIIKNKFEENKLCEDCRPSAIKKTANKNDFVPEYGKCKFCGEALKIGEDNKCCKGCRYSAIEIKCQACDEIFTVQIYTDISGVFAAFYHSFCPIVTKRKSDTVSSNYKKCGCVFRTRIQSTIALNLCPLCSFEEFEREVDVKKADVLETLRLNCENCQEEVFLRLSAKEGCSEFHHNNCPRKLNLTIKP